MGFKSVYAARVKFSRQVPQRLHGHYLRSKQYAGTGTYTSKQASTAFKRASKALVEGHLQRAETCLKANQGLSSADFEVVLLTWVDGCWV